MCVGCFQKREKELKKQEIGEKWENFGQNPNLRENLQKTQRFTERFLQRKEIKIETKMNLEKEIGRILEIIQNL